MSIDPALAYCATPWSRAIHARLEEFQQRRSGIDRHVLLPVSAEVSTLAKRLVDLLYTEGVPAPSVYHGDVGSVDVEWVVNGWHVHISVAEAYHVDGWVTRPGAADEDAEYLRDIRDLGEAVQRLVKHDSTSVRPSGIPMVGPVTPPQT